MRSLLLIWLAQCLVLISASPPLPQLEARAPSYCTDPVIKVVTTVLKLYASPASKICSDLLKRGPNPTKTVTDIRTVTTTVTSGITTVTETRGVATVSTTSTDISTVNNEVTATATTTVPETTTIVVATVTNTAIVTVATTSATSTTSYTQVLVPPPNASPALKRQAADTLGKKYPGCPKPLSSIVLSIATKACDCFIPVSTKTVTVTQTSTSTVTVKATATTSVPSSTSTAVVIEYIIRTVDTTKTITLTATSTLVVSQTATTSTTVTTTTTNVATSTQTSTTTYNKVQEDNTPPSCVYNRYYDYPSVSNDPANNYKAGIDDCAGRCNRNPSCKFWYFLKFDPNLARGFDGAACILDDQPYDPSLLQCGYVNSYGVGYNKGAVVVT